MRPLIAAVFLILANCSHASTVQPADAGPVRTADGSAFVLPDGAVPVTFCGGSACVAGQECCFATGQCAAIGDRSACPLAADATNGGCAANSQCGPTEYCIVTSVSITGCTGAGRCSDRSNCGSGYSEPVCGCDGRTYANAIAACNAGVRTVSWAAWNTVGACGVPSAAAMTGVRGDAGFDASVDPAAASRTPCLIDDQCPSGQRCCALTNACFDPAHPEMCRMPPAGSDFPCLSNADCDPRWDMCVGGPACDSPGFCARPPAEGPCTGVLEPVCGCDGRTYTNSCEALVNHVRIASDAGCGDS